MAGAAGDSAADWVDWEASAPVVTAVAVGSIRVMVGIEVVGLSSMSKPLTVARATSEATAPAVASRSGMAAGGGGVFVDWFGIGAAGGGELALAQLEAARQFGGREGGEGLLDVFDVGEPLLPFG